jgi:hypothetical protein
MIYLTFQPQTSDFLLPASNFFLYPIFAAL